MVDKYHDFSQVCQSPKPKEQLVVGILQIETGIRLDSPGYLLPLTFNYTTVTITLYRFTIWFTCKFCEKVFSLSLSLISELVEIFFFFLEIVACQFNMLRFSASPVFSL